VVVRQDVDAEADPDSFCDLAQGAEDDLGARRAGEPGQEVVLDEPEGVEADLVGQRALLERLLVQAVPVNAGTFEGALHLVEKAKLHRRTSLGLARPALAIIVGGDAARKPSAVARGRAWSAAGLGLGFRGQVTGFG